MGRDWGWPWFVAWTFAGGLLVFSLLTGFSIGLFVLPFALVACWAVARGSRPWPAALGVLSGAGLVALAVALLNRDYNPCPPNGMLSVPPGETSVTCGGLDPRPWWIAGFVLVAVGIAAHVLARSRGPRLRRWN